MQVHPQSNDERQHARYRIWHAGGYDYPYNNRAGWQPRPLAQPVWCTRWCLLHDGFPLQLSISSDVRHQPRHQSFYLSFSADVTSAGALVYILPSLKYWLCLGRPSWSVTACREVGYLPFFNNERCFCGPSCLLQASNAPPEVPTEPINRDDLKSLPVCVPVCSLILGRCLECVPLGTYFPCLNSSHSYSIR